MVVGRVSVCLVVVVLSSIACGGSKKGGQSGPNGQTNGPNAADPAGPGSQPPAAPAPAPTAVPGALTVDLSGSTAVGVVEVDANSALKGADGTVITPAQVGVVGASLTAGTAKVLAKLTPDGPVGFVLPPEVKNIPVELLDVTAAGAWGTVLRFSLPDQFLVKTNLALIDAKDGGKVKPLRPEGTTELRCDRVEYDDADRLFALCGASLYTYDFAKAAFTAVTDGELLVERFLRLADGNVYLQGRVKTSDAKFLRRLKPNGGFEDLVSPRGQLVFESVASLGTRGVMANRVMRVVDDQLKFHFLPESYFKADGDLGPGITVNNAWLVANGGERRFAFDLSTDKVAGNPLGSSVPRNLFGGSKAAVPHTNVDSVEGLYYDGANVVSLEHSAAAIAAKQALKLVYGNGPSLKIERLFGPDHGFTGATWYGYAVAADGALFWVAVDKATGVVDVANRKRIALPDGKAAIDVTNDTTVYGVGSKKVVYSNGSYPTAQLSWLEEGPDGDLTMNAKLAAFAGAAAHAVSLVAGDKLYAVLDNSYYVYDPSTAPGAIAQSARIHNALLSGEGEVTAEHCAIARRHKALVRSADPTKPYLLSRICNASGSADGAFALLRVTSLAFSAVELQVDTGFTKLDLNDDSAQASLVRAKEGDGTRLLLAVRSTAKLRPLKADLSGVEPTDRFSTQIVTDGFVAFAGKYPATAGAVEVALPWAGDSFLVAGNVGAGYKSYRVNLRETKAKIEDDALYAIKELDGVQVYGGGLDKAGTLIVSGLRSSDGKRVLVRFSPQFEPLGVNDTANVKVLKVVATED